METLIISSRTCRVQCEQPMMSDLITLHREFKVSLTSIGYQECLITSWQKTVSKTMLPLLLVPRLQLWHGHSAACCSLGFALEKKIQHDLQHLKIFKHHPAITKQVIEIWTKWCSHKIWNQSLPKHLLVTLTTGILCIFGKHRMNDGNVLGPNHTSQTTESWHDAILHAGL